MATSGPSRVIRCAAVLAALSSLAACGGREDMAPVEYLWDGGAVTSPASGAVTPGDLPPVESAPLAPVDRGGIEVRPLDEPTPVDAVPMDAAPAIAAPVTGGEVVGTGETVVASGETLSAVSRRTGVPMRDMIVENGLAAPFTLQPGQRLRLPEARYHTVAAGDTVYNISRRYGVDQASLMRENGIEAPFTIKLGQRLRIPGRVQTPVAAETAPPDVSGP
ncbi:MAG: LysM peptidoglycan-binding domain-containing protein, partial [Zavarzinia sp.]|nr:LysM peptidoglycan-binding domain-containing protein [Zavarzinia sp.]